MASEEVVVALALGIPSLLVAAISLWIAFLTFTHSHLLYHAPHSLTNHFGAACEYMELRLQWASGASSISVY
ncbi:hypothetical protein PG990_002383 [Apiospora arundinis]|uniref:Uncharacterized protein n=1 Tax=Apiospora arundinis TaxID=335852 RepID=A0ABR2I634_9PEZI